MQSANDSITRSLALEWGTDFGIRVNNLAPGPIGETPGMDKLRTREGDEIFELIPLKKMGEKWDIAMAAIYLASDAGMYTHHNEEGPNVSCVRSILLCTKSRWDSWLNTPSPLQRNT